MDCEENSLMSLYYFDMLFLHMKPNKCKHNVNVCVGLNPLSVGFWNAFCLMTPMWLQIVNWCIVYGIWNSSWRGVTRPLHVC